jgi:zinc transport system substrate-binding protein
MVWRFYPGITASVIVLLCLPQLQAQETPAEKLHIFVSIAPQAYFVERIGGARADVEILVAPGQSPEIFEPTPKQMAALSRADIYFRIGLPFEDRLLDKLSAANDNVRIIDTREGITLRQIEEHADGGHDEGHDHHGQPDPHIWLSPRLVEIQARHIVDGLTALDSLGKAVYEQNLMMFTQDLRQIDSTIAEILAPLKERKIYVFHPAFGYFTDAYKLTQVAVETGGKEPGGQQLADLISRAQRDSVRVVFVQPQFSQKSARTIAEAIGGTVVPLDPLARDYLENLRRLARTIERTLAGRTPGAGE